MKDVIHDICKEYKLDHPRVRFSSTNSPVGLDANAALLENHVIVVDEARKESKEAKPGESIFARVGSFDIVSFC